MRFQDENQHLLDVWDGLQGRCSCEMCWILSSYGVLWPSVVRDREGERLSRWRKVPGSWTVLLLVIKESGDFGSKCSPRCSSSGVCRTDATLRNAKNHLQKRPLGAGIQLQVTSAELYSRRTVFDFASGSCSSPCLLKCSHNANLHTNMQVMNDYRARAVSARKYLFYFFGRAQWHVYSINIWETLLLKL